MFDISDVGKETLKLQENLASQYKYKPQPTEVAKDNMQRYIDDLPAELINGSLSFTESVGYELPGKRMNLVSKDGTPFARGYDRIVIGHYGAFLEIDPENMIMDDVIVKRGQEYRINDPKYSKNVKYQWFTTNDDSNIKLYYQQKGVTYADYKPGKWYVSPFEVCTEKELEQILDVETSKRYVSITYKAITRVEVDDNLSNEEVIEDAKRQLMNHLDKFPSTQIQFVSVDSEQEAEIENDEMDFEF